MKKKWTRAIAAIACTICALVVLQLLVVAEEPSTLQVWPCATDLTDMRTDLNGADGQGEPLLRYDLYKIADFDTVEFKVGDNYPGIHIPADIDSKGWREVADKAAQTIFWDENGNVKETLSIKPDVENAMMGFDQLKLEHGLYLIVAHHRDQSYKEYLGKSKEGKLVTRYQGHENLYSFLPDLVAIPTKPAVDGEINTANPGEWMEDVVVYLKPEKEAPLGSLIINKNLLSYSNDSPVTFGFHVVAEKDGKVVYDKIFSMDFTGAGSQSLRVDGLPVGATVTVREIYQGAGCKLVEEVKPSDPTVSADTVLEFSFTNDFDNTDKGHGILNTFVYDGEKWVLNRSDTAEGGESQ